MQNSEKCLCFPFLKLVKSVFSMYRNVFRFSNKKIEKNKKQKLKSDGPMMCTAILVTCTFIFFFPYIIFSLVTGIQLVCLLSMKSISSALLSVYNKGFLQLIRKVKAEITLWTCRDRLQALRGLMRTTKDV